MEGAEWGIEAKKRDMTQYKITPKTLATRQGETIGA